VGKETITDRPTIHFRWSALPNRTRSTWDKSMSCLRFNTVLLAAVLSGVVTRVAKAEDNPFWPEADLFVKLLSLA
jgi:hypothetical protein